MNIQITFKNMEHSDPMEQHIRKHLEKIEHFLHNERDPIFIHVFLEPSKVHRHHRIELLVKSPNYDLSVAYEHEGMDFYITLDRVINQMLDRLQDEHQRKITERKMVGRHEEFKKER